MKKIENKTVVLALRFFSVFAFVILIIAFLKSDIKFNAKTLKFIVPDNDILALVFILVLFAIKSIFFVIPVILLYIVTSAVFDTQTAILVNSLGTIVAMTIPYLIGYHTGSQYSNKLISKHPKIKNLLEQQKDNEWFISFFLRAISFIPVEVGSLYLGSLKITYGKYILMSLLGVFPSLVATTIAGANIKNPTSPAFIISISVSLILSIVSLLIYRYMTKSKTLSN